MFDKVVIHLDGPICSCPMQDLSWVIIINADRRASLKVICDTCNLSLNVPSDKFVAGFALLRPYPGGFKRHDLLEKKEKETGDVDSTDPGDIPDNVIKLFRKKEDET